MRRQFLWTAAVVAASLILYFSVCLFVPSPISAEYWVRELIAVQRMLVDSISSPRIIFLGGSSTLFGIDAKQVEAETGIPAMNMGMHAGLRLERVLSVGEDVARRGDILVLALEPGFYDCGHEAWSGWQVRNALAWDRRYFRGLPLLTRIQAIFSGGRPTLAAEILTDRILSAINPSGYVARLQALAPIEEIWERYQSGKWRTSHFAYSAYNVDARGDMQNNIGEEWAGPGAPVTWPDGVCSDALSVLSGFVARLRTKDIRVLVTHTPYLIDEVPPVGWEIPEANFARSIRSSGAELLEHRSELFFPRAYFFNFRAHLNEVGRRVRTNNIISDLKKLDVAKAPANHDDDARRAQ